MSKKYVAIKNSGYGKKLYPAKFSVTLTTELSNSLNRYCQRHDLDKSAVVRRALVKFFKDE